MVDKHVSMYWEAAHHQVIIFLHVWLDMINMIMIDTKSYVDAVWMWGFKLVLTVQLGRKWILTDESEI